MSKQVLVTAHDGSQATFDGVADIFVEGGALWLTDSDGKTISVSRSWESAERIQTPHPSILDDDAPVGEVSPFYINVGPPAKDCTRLCCPSCCDKECK